MTYEEFTQLIIERDRAVAGTFEEFKTYAIKMGQVPNHPESLEIMYHKCRTAVLSLPDEVRKASHSWLIERGYSSWLGL